jgi:hypothetical protein
MEHLPHQHFCEVGRVRSDLGCRVGVRTFAAALFAVRCALMSMGCSAATPSAQSRTGPTVPCPFADGAARAAAAARLHETVVAPKKKAWEASLGGEVAARPLVQARLAGWPAQLLVTKASLPESDRDFALRVAQDTWRGLDALRDRENGLPVDNVRFPHGSVNRADARVGDYTSGSNIGVHLMAVVAARDLQLISDAQAVERVRGILDTLQQLETYRGFYFNFYDTTSLERTSNFISFVDSSWLTAGLMVVRMALPELRDACSKLIAQTHYGFFYDPRTRLLSHGYYVTRQRKSPFDYGMLYTEARLGSLIAIGKGDVPEEQWFEMVRTFPADCRGQTLAPQAVRTQRVRGHVFSAGYYEWKGMRYVPSWGGSMFEALMPTLVLDECQYAPKSLGATDVVHAQVQRQYALDELGYGVWGISSSATPAGDDYSEYGIPVLGARGYDGGAVTPHASALALGIMPAAALANLRTLAQLYDIYGEYGFYDAVDPGSGVVACKYLALDQSILFVALANYLGDHCIQSHFSSDPITQKALPVIAEEDFFN